MKPYLFNLLGKIVNLEVVRLTQTYFGEIVKVVFTPFEVNEFADSVNMIAITLYAGTTLVFPI